MSNIMISGASGLIGTELADRLKNDNTLYLLSRVDRPGFVKCDVTKPIEFNQPLDIVIHLASNTSPELYAKDPVGTMMCNIEGTRNLLECAIANGATKFIFASSIEVYGNNCRDVIEGDESTFNVNNLRSIYPLSKACGELLCKAYSNKIDIVILRLPRVFGKHMHENDSKSTSYFLKKAIAGEDIIMNSAGNQVFGMSYVKNIVDDICVLMEIGSGTYNLHSEDISLRRFAELCGEYGDVDVVSNIKTDNYANNSSYMTMNCSKICNLYKNDNYVNIESAIKEIICG